MLEHQQMRLQFYYHHLPKHVGVDNNKEHTQPQAHVFALMHSEEHIKTQL